MKSSTLAKKSLFESKEAILSFVKEVKCINSICVYHPIIESWEQDSKMIYFLIDINRGFPEKDLNDAINKFKKAVRPLIGSFFEVAARDNIESIAKEGFTNESKDNMQERVDCAIPLENLTNEPLNTQFHEKRKKILKMKTNCSIVLEEEKHRKTTLLELSSNHKRKSTTTDDLLQRQGTKKTFSLVYGEDKSLLSSNKKDLIKQQAPSIASKSPAFHQQDKNLVSRLGFNKDKSLLLPSLPQQQAATVAGSGVRVIPGVVSKKLYK